MDLAKHQYATYLQEGVGLIPALRAVPSSVGSSHQREEVKEGVGAETSEETIPFSPKAENLLGGKVQYRPVHRQ